MVNARQDMFHQIDVSRGAINPTMRLAETPGAMLDIDCRFMMSWPA
jgi:hypothetical protein